MTRLTAPDWFRVISDLIYHGISMREVSRTIDVQMGENLIRYYRSGGQPNYVRGEALIRLWCQITGKPPADIPRQPWYPPARIRRKENRT